MARLMRGTSINDALRHLGIHEENSNCRTVGCIEAPDTTYTPIQRKFYQVARLLVEIRLLAAKQGAAYRADNRLPIARQYENIAHSLQDNMAGQSLGSMVNILEKESGEFYKNDITVTDAEIKAAMTDLLRYVNAHRPEALARITEEYVLGNEKTS